MLFQWTNARFGSSITKPHTYYRKHTHTQTVKLCVKPIQLVETTFSFSWSKCLSSKTMVSKLPPTITTTTITTTLLRFLSCTCNGNCCHCEHYELLCNITRKQSAKQPSCSVFVCVSLPLCMLLMIMMINIQLCAML